MTATDIQQLIDEGVAALKATTVGYANHSAAWRANKTTQWYKALDKLAQARLALDQPSPPPAPTGKRPYTTTSPWNTPIPANPALAPNSTQMVGRILAKHSVLTCDPTQYTVAVYEVPASQPLVDVHSDAGSFTYTTVTGAVQSTGAKILKAPVPQGAEPSAGDDAQMVVIQGADEWNFGVAHWEADGLHCDYASRYNTNLSGVITPPDFWRQRGAGVPLLAGLIRPWEIAQGKIEHALCFAFDTPMQRRFVNPVASKADGDDLDPNAIPEGARLQLDPALNLDTLGLTPTGKIIARAMQEYGMFLIDHAGRAKVYLEYRETAKWGSEVNDMILSAVPLSRLRVLAHGPILETP